MPAPSQKSFGKYTLLRELGRGGFGVVHLARDEELKREVALKMLLGPAAADAEEVARLKREAQAAARLRHPNVMQIYEVGTEEGRTYFTMEYLKGRTLAAAARELGERRKLEVVRDVAQALEYAHQAGVIHRDVKPSNIMLEDGGRVCLMDFGLAKHLEDSKNLTLSGTVLGTPNYMSPEQAGARPELLDGRSDVFALGSVMYWLITGTPAFERADAIHTLAAVVFDDPRRPRSVNPAVGREAETVCLKALEKARERRYQTAGEFAADVDRLLAGAPVLAKAPGAAERALRWSRRHPLRLALVLVVLAAAGALGWMARAHARETDWMRREGEEAERRRGAERAAAARRAKSEEWLAAARERMEVAERAMMSGRGAELKAALDGAVRALDRALAEDGSLAAAFALRGRARRLRGDASGAEEDLGRAIDLDGALAAAFLERGLLRLDRFMEVKNELQAALGSGNLAALEGRARDRQLEAAGDLARAAELDAGPGREWASRLARAALAFLAGKLPESVADLDKVLEASPFRDDALVLRAYVRLLLPGPDLAAARADLDRAVEANALNARAFNLRGLVRRRAGELPGALEDFTRALALDPGFWIAVLNRAEARGESGEIEAGVADYSAVLGARPSCSLALFGRGELLKRFGRTEEARRDFERFLKEFPKHPRAGEAAAVLQALETR
ncbi:MAG: protein kinase [Planctomycetes bacterium]|nr:protein kinase [Planctomycetota bacterium]